MNSASKKKPFPGQCGDSMRTMNIIFSKLLTTSYCCPRCFRQIKILPDWQFLCPYIFGLLSLLSSGHPKSSVYIPKSFSNRHSGKCMEAKRNQYKRFTEPFLKVQSSRGVFSKHRENVT